MTRNTSLCSVCLFKTGHTVVPKYDAMLQSKWVCQLCKKLVSHNFMDCCRIARRIWSC